MNKKEFIDALHARLSGLPRKEVEERLSFYAEMIDDRVEEGLSEEDAVKDVGSIESITHEIVSEIPLRKIIKEKIKPQKSLRAWEIVLLALGAPIWFSLLAAAFSVIVSLWVALWSIVASLWVAFASLIVAALGYGIVVSLAFIFRGEVLLGLALFGCGLLSAALAIFLFYGCKAATKGMAVLTKKSILGIKSLFLKKRRKA